MFRRISLCLILAAAAPALSLGAARAEGAARDDANPAANTSSRAAAVADRAHLQGELDRVNAEIDALKRSPRGLRDDYRLRARMADAESLARRLTDLDARLGPAPGGQLGGPAGGPDLRADAIWRSAPQASRLDDAADREAKADILDDQARRLAKQADLLDRRVTELHARRELRRRSGQLERDPFSPLEQAKSRVGVNDGLSRGDVKPPGTFGGTPQPVGATTGSSGATPVIPGTPTLTPSAADNPTSLAAQFRGSLDAASLAEIRRLEAPAGGSATGDLPAMERALAALRARAARLATDAAALRRPASKLR
jgi:hypothetical protein